MGTKLSDYLWQEALIQAPLFIACTIGLIVALRFHKKAPAATPWLVGAFLLALAASVYVMFSNLFENRFATYFLVPSVRSVALLLLLVGAYAGRKDLTLTPGAVPPHIWDPLLQTLRARPGLKRVFLSIFIMVWVLVFIFSAIWTFITPEAYFSSAQVKLSVPTNTPGTVVTVDDRFLKTECQVIMSEMILDPVIKALDLNRVWGEKMQSGVGPLKTDLSRRLLQATTDVRIVPDTAILEIRVMSDNPKEAAEIANVVALKYRDYHAFLRSQASLSGSAIVDLVTTARPNHRPFRPNKVFDLFHGTWAGLWLGFIAALLVTGLALRARTPASPPQPLPSLPELAQN